MSEGLKRRVPPWLKRRLATGVPRAIITRLVKTGGAPQWMREVMVSDHRRTFDQLGHDLDVVEVSGEFWGDEPWRSHTNLDFPAFDLCAPPDDRWVSRFPWQSLRNEPQLPVVVWSLARPS